MDIAKIEKLSKYDIAQYKNEEDVKVNFIVPLFEALGHDRLEFEHDRMDIMIRCTNSKYTILVEAKHHTKYLGDSVVQLNEYWNKLHSLVAVLCNGKELWIYHPKWYGRHFQDTRMFVIKQGDLLRQDNLNILDNLLSHSALATGKAKDFLREYEDKYELHEQSQDEVKSHVEAIEAELANIRRQRDQEIRQIDDKYAGSIGKLESELADARKGLDRTELDIVSVSEGYSDVTGDELSAEALDDINYYGLTSGKQIMVLTTRVSNPGLLVLWQTDSPSKSKASPLGLELRKKGLPKFKGSSFVAKVEIISIINNKDMWLNIAKDPDLFPYWDPIGGPYKKIEDNKKKKNSIMVCRVYKIDYLIPNEACGGGMVQRKIKTSSVIDEINNRIESMQPVIPDDSIFTDRRNRLLHIVEPFRR